MRHRLGTLILVVGLGVLAWSATVYLWKDPFTTTYTAYEQPRRGGAPHRPARDPATRPRRGRRQRDQLGRSPPRARPADGDVGARGGRARLCRGASDDLCGTLLGQRQASPR